MIKTLLLAVLFIAIGYVVAVFFPMPQSIEQDLHSLVGTVEADAQDAKNAVDAVSYTHLRAHETV